MSYDFLMMRTRSPVQSPDDLNEKTVVAQNPADVVDALSKLFPALVWEHEAAAGWFGKLDAEDGWYEFRLGDQLEEAWLIRTSHRAATRSQVQTICTALGLVAFDGQANVLIKPDSVAARERA